MLDDTRGFIRRFKVHTKDDIHMYKKYRVTFLDPVHLPTQRGTQRRRAHMLEFYIMRWGHLCYRRPGTLVGHMVDEDFFSKVVDLERM